MVYVKVNNTRKLRYRKDVRAISFQDFQLRWSWSTNVTDGQTDRRHAISIKGMISITQSYSSSYRNNWILNKSFKRQVFPDNQLTTRLTAIQRKCIHKKQRKQTSANVLCIRKELLTDWSASKQLVEAAASAKVKVKADIALHGNPISELRDVTCHMGSHSVTCHPTQVNAPRLNPSHAGWYSIYLLRGMEGWLDLVDLIAPRLGVEPATSRSRVRHRTAAPPR